MSDIITEFSLPSNGKLYSDKVQYKNQLRAPRLKDKGLGDSTKQLKLQASVLDKTIVQPLGMSAYDLHTADFVYLNWIQRRLSKGNAPYRISVRCPKCGKLSTLDVQLEELEVLPLSEVPQLSYITRDNNELELTYITPRMLDDSIDNANAFLEQYPEAEMSFGTLRTQELLRLIIRKVNGTVLTEAKMTDFISNMYDDDVTGVLDIVNDFDFGVQTKQTLKCKCGHTVTYTVPVG